MSRENRCSICGRPRLLEVKRSSFSINKTTFVPRTGNPDDKPAQYINDLILNVGVWRNGGGDEKTHICNDCISVGLRKLKIDLAEVLSDMDKDYDKDKSIIDLTDRLANLQYKYHIVCFDHDRMQDRLSHVLSHLDKHEIKDDDKIEYARWEVARGPVIESASKV